MGLFYILEQFTRKLGLQVSDPTARALALKYINPAALELYNLSDMSGCLDEQLFKVNSNQEIAFPPYMGNLRAMRYASWYKGDIKLSQMRPNYNQFNWEQAWKNWRIKDTRTLEMSLQNQSQLIIQVPTVEDPPIVVNVSGPTLQAANATESITMTQTTMNTQITSTNLTRLLSAAIFGALALSCGTMSIAADDSNAPQAVVKFGDLNLSNPQGAAALYQRIWSAAVTVCRPQDDGSLASKGRMQTCVHKAIADAVTKVGQPGLFAIYNAKNREPLPITVASAKSP